METPAIPPTPAELAALREDAKLPFQCKVCQSRLGPQSIWRISSAHNSGEHRKVKASPPKSGIISPKQQVYCSPCADARLREKELAKTHRPAHNQMNGEVAHIPPRLLGKDAALAQVREKKAAEAAALAGPPVWEMVEPGVFRAAGGLKIQKVDSRSWRVLCGKVNIVMKGLQEAFEVAAELRKG